MTVRIRYIAPNSYGSEQLSNTLLTGVVRIEAIAAVVAIGSKIRAVTVTMDNTGVLTYENIVSMKVWP